MAQSNVPITAGSGTNIDTFTTTTQANRRQAVVIADPATDANTTPVHATLGAGINILGANGTALDTNSGLKSAGTTRVVIATDQPALTNKLLVTPDSVALPANQSVNVSQINGVAPLMGSGIMGTGSHRVTIASDNDALTVKQATAANLNAAVVGTGTAGVPAGNILTVQGVASMTKLLVTPDSVALPANQSVNVAQVAGTATVTSIAGSPGIGGDTASAATDAGNPVKIGAQARTSEITAVTNAQRVNIVADVVGKQIILPYANPENFLSGTASAIGTVDTSTIAAQGVGVRIYVTQFTTSNSSATNAVVDIKDGTTILYTVPCPANGGSVINFPVPLKLTANTALNSASKTAATTIYFNASGYKGV